VCAVVVPRKLRSQQQAGIQDLLLDLNFCCPLCDTLVLGCHRVAQHAAQARPGCILLFSAR
jgi:hypothetical protein